MKNNFGLLFADPRIKQISWINGFMLIPFLLLSIWKYSVLPPQLPLFYSLPRSTNQLGSTVEIFILPIFAVCFAVVNYYIASIVYQKERLAAIFLCGTSAAVSLLLLITFVKIIFLVT